MGFYASLGMPCVSVRTNYYYQHFRDADHLAAYLGTAGFLLGRQYDDDQDREALELYAKVNAAPKGIRMVRPRMVGVYHKAPANQT